MKITRLLPLLALAIALPGCDPGPAPAPATQETGIAAKPGIAILGGTLTLPPVKGNPGAVYFDITNNGPPTAIVAADVKGAERSEMHNVSEGQMSPMPTLPLDTGQSVSFSRGQIHVMAFNLDDALKPGDTSEVTLTFDNGDKVSAPLSVVGAGSGPLDSGPMPMDGAQPGEEPAH